MRQFNIAVLVGSLRRESNNKQLANGLAKLAPPDFVFNHLRIDDLPPYNQDDDTQSAEQVKRLNGEVTAAKRLLFVTPEDNRSIPGG